METPKEPKLLELHVPQATPVEGEMVVNMGPQHPATHGVLNFVLVTDGEVIHKAIPNCGYLHRGIEKLGEMTSYPGFMPYTDRVDYLAAMTANQGFAMAVEMLLGLEVPPRAEYCRVIAAELNRIASHLVATGTAAMDLGAFTPFTHWLRERETINDLTEELCGARLTYNYMRIGGVSEDLPDGFKEQVLRFLDHFEPIISEFNRLISLNEIFIHRLVNLAPISREDAINWGLVGPNLRASGVEIDIRKTPGYSVYGDFDFNMAVGRGFKGTVGDSYDRYYVRIVEMQESCAILRQALEKLPDGPVMADVPRKIKPEKNEAYARVESARGEMGYYVISDGTDKPYRLKIKAGSFPAMAMMEKVTEGVMVADVVALISAFDLVAPEVDR
jgi:NADH-quinone oxidoreductase subunit D